MQETSVSLLERVRQGSDQEAWARFVRLYTPLIYYWGRRCGLPCSKKNDESTNLADPPSTAATEPSLPAVRAAIMHFLVCGPGTLRGHGD